VSCSCGECTDPQLSALRSEGERRRGPDSCPSPPPLGRSPTRPDNRKTRSSSRLVQCSSLREARGTRSRKPAQAALLRSTKLALLSLSLAQRSRRVRLVAASALHGTRRYATLSRYRASWSRMALRSSPSLGGASSDRSSSTPMLSRYSSRTATTSRSDLSRRERSILRWSRACKEGRRRARRSVEGSAVRRRKREKGKRDARRRPPCTPTPRRSRRAAARTGRCRACRGTARRRPCRPPLPGRRPCRSCARALRAPRIGGRPSRSPTRRTWRGGACAAACRTRAR